MTFFITYDIGTTACKTCLYSIDTELKLIASYLNGYPLITLPNGGSEQKVEDWWNAICEGTKETLSKSKIKPEMIKGIAFCTQMQGTLIVNKKGESLRNPMIWLDARSNKQFEDNMRGKIEIGGYDLKIILKCIYYTGGGPGSAKDPLFKYLWIKENEPDIFRKIYKWLDVKDYLTLKCTGNIKQTLDSAQLTWLFDSRKKGQKWSKSLCNEFKVDMSHLPDVIKSTDEVGKLTKIAADEMGLVVGIPVYGGGGDATLIPIGAGCLEEYDSHIYVGTSGWVVSNVKKRFLDINHLIGSVINAIPGFYNLIGEQETAGICLQWVRDHLALDEIGVYLDAKNVADLNEERITLFDYLSRIVKEVKPGSEGVIFTPWMHGNRSPAEDPYVKGMFFNIGLNNGKRDMIRSVLEGVAFHMRWMFEFLKKKLPVIDILRFVGGGAQSEVWCQIMADVLECKIETVDDPQNAGTAGAAIVCAVGSGLYSSFNEAKNLIKVSKIYYPNLENKAIYDRNFGVFKQLYKNNKDSYRILNE